MRTATPFKIETVFAVSVIALTISGCREYDCVPDKNCVGSTTISACSETEFGAETRESSCGEGGMCIGNKYSAYCVSDTLKNCPSMIVGNGDLSWKLAVADFNEDGLEDLVVVDEKSIRVRLGTKTGLAPFLPALAFAGGTKVLARDIDGDQHSDLVLLSDRSLTLILGNGRGSFAAQRKMFGIPVAKNFLVANVGGGGGLDLVVPSAKTGITVIVDPMLSGTVAETAYNTSFEPADYRVVAVPRPDGRAVLAQLDQGIIFVYRLGDDNLWTATTGARTGRIDNRQILSSDWDRDGFGDLMIEESRKLKFFRGLNDGTFVFQTISPESCGISELVDLDGDGVDDGVGAGAGLTLCIATITSTGLANPAAFVPSVLGEIKELDAGDFDGDGSVDIIANVAVGSNKIRDGVRIDSASRLTIARGSCLR